MAMASASIGGGVEESVSERKMAMASASIDGGGEESVSERKMAKASAFIDGALQDIELLRPNFPLEKDKLDRLQVHLRSLRAFLLCARGSSSSSVMGSLLSGLEDSLFQNGEDFHILCLRQKVDPILVQEWDRTVVQGIIQYETCIRSCNQEIIEFCITLSDSCAWQSWYQLKEFFDSLLVNMADIARGPDFRTNQDPNLIDAFKDRLVFFINFIRFAELRGFEPRQLQVLFTRLHVVAVNAAILCYHWNIKQAKLFHEFHLKFSELLLKIRPVDPQIREIYIHVLTASNVSRLSHALTLETDKHVLGDFIDSLLCQIVEALSYGDSYMVSLNDQVPALYEGLRFLRTILTKHLEKIDELHKKAKDLIGAAVNEAAIVICLLPVPKLEEGLVKEMDFALLNFLEKIKLIKVITSLIIFSKTNEHGFIEFLLENLKELPSCTVDSIAFAKDQIQTVQEDLVYLRSFLESILDNRKHNGKLQSLWNRVIDVAYKIHFVILSLVGEDIPNCSPLGFRTIIDEINLIKLESLKIVDNHYNSYSEAKKATNTSNPLPSQCGTPTINKIPVTLDDEMNKIIERLTRGSKKIGQHFHCGHAGITKDNFSQKCL